MTPNFIANRRMYPRRVCNLSVKIDCGESQATIVARCIGIGVGGMNCRILVDGERVPLHVGNHVTFHLDTAEKGKAKIIGSGEVAWMRHGAEFGVSFDRLANAHQKALVNLLAKLGS